VGGGPAVTSAATSAEVWLSPWRWASMGQAANGEGPVGRVVVPLHLGGLVPVRHVTSLSVRERASRCLDRVGSATGPDLVGRCGGGSPPGDGGPPREWKRGAGAGGGMDAGCLDERGDR